MSLEQSISDLVENKIRRATVETVETLEENQSYSIELEDDDELYFVEVIQTDEVFPLAPCVEAYVNNRTTIPVDTVLASGTETLDGTEYSFYISRLAPGDGLESFEDLDAQTRENLYVKIGEYLGQLHANFEVDSYGPLKGDSNLSVETVEQLSEEDNYYSIAKEAVEMHSVELGHLEPEVEDFFDTHSTELSQTTPSFIHPCLTAENIVVDSGYTITALNGWEHTQSGTPIENLIQTQILLVNSKFDEEQKVHKYRNALYMGYQRHNALPDDFSEIYEMYYTLALFHLLAQHSAIDCSVDFLVSELEPRLGQTFTAETDETEDVEEETDETETEDDDEETEDDLFGGDAFESEDEEETDETETETEEVEEDEDDDEDDGEGSDEEAETDDEWFDTFGEFDEDEFEIEDDETTQSMTEDADETGDKTESEEVESEEDETEEIVEPEFSDETEEVEEETDETEDEETDEDSVDESENEAEDDSEETDEVTEDEEVDETEETEDVDDFFTDLDDEEEDDDWVMDSDEDSVDESENEAEDDSEETDEVTEDEEVDETEETEGDESEEETEDEEDEDDSELDNEIDEDKDETESWESDDDWEF